jgi:Caspase domain
MEADPAMLAESHAVLVGVSAYEYAEFPPIRAARNSLEAMRSVLSDPALCAWPPERITVIANPVSAAGLATTIADLAESTTGVLLLYYVGHGVLSAHGELCLTVTSTRPDRPKISGLPWDTLADVLRGCPAHTRLAILDCCFAGQAVEALTGGGDPGLADIVHVEGVYTLTATTRNHAAHVPPPGQQDTVCTSFTSELRDLIRSGIPGKAPQLTFSDIYPVLHQRLRAKGLPVPSQHGTDTARQFPFTANAAAPTELQGQGVPAENQGSPAAAQSGAAPGQSGAAPGQSGAAPAQSGPAPAQSDAEPAQGAADPVQGDTESDQAGPSRHGDIVTNALRATHSITDESVKARALVAVAQALEATDPERSGRLIADAERVAQAISEPVRKASALADVAGPLATIAPDRAESAAGSITDESLKARALAGVAEALAATDPERSGRLFADAERIARAIPSAARKSSALAGVAEALTGSDSDHAERVAHSITEPTLTAAVLTTLARSVAESDPDRAGRLAADAERVAQSITGASFRAPATAAVARALATADPYRAGRLIADAEHIAQSIPDPARKAAALAAVAEGLAAIDPGHAERVAQSITGADSRALALAAVARALAATTPHRAA